MNRSLSARLAILTICGATLAGCAKKPSEKEVVDSIVSWTGTGDLAAQAWLDHSTFDRYTRRTLERSAEEIAEQSGQLGRSAPFREPALDSAITSIRRSLLRMAALIAANDAPGVRAQLDTLRSEKRFVLRVAGTLDQRR